MRDDKPNGKRVRYSAWRGAKKLRKTRQHNERHRVRQSLAHLEEPAPLRRKVWRWR
jgi:hypothetical protein